MKWGHILLYAIVLAQDKRWLVHCTLNFLEA